MALVVAFAGGLAARRVGLPTIVGYLLAGIVIGPFTPGFVGDVETIQQLAELGVIFLMFGVGLHFSFADLWRVRDIAVPGAVLQTTLSVLLGFGLSQAWGWTPASGVVLGLAISVASTVVLLRGLMDNNLLDTPHGQSAVGWLVMEDILSVLILVIMPALAPSAAGFDWTHLLITLAKAAGFVVIMFFGGVRLIPWLLERVAHLRSRELFILVILAVTLGVAVGAASIFGVSLALGAFVAGAIISQSHLSHQVGAEVFSFREAFAVLFFVSVGMLVNPAFVWQHLGQVGILLFLIIIGKGLIVLLLGLIIPRPARTFLVVAVGLSQIGEFSFIIGQAGLSLGLLDSDHYSMILAGALFSITLNPFIFRLLPRLEKLLQRAPGLWRRLESNRPLPAVDTDSLKGHVVIIGYGRVGSQLVNVLESLETPRLVIETDLEKVEALVRHNTPALFGDAASPEIINHAHLETARALVCTVPEETTATLIVTAARDINPELPIIVRAASVEGVLHLGTLGAHHVVHPELEGGLELLHHTLLELGYPLRQVHSFTEAVRRDHYNTEINTDEEHRTLHEMIAATEGIEVSWLPIEDESPLVGISLAEANLRARTGASVVAVIRSQQLIPNPKSGMEFEAGDRVGMIGEEEQIQAAREWISGDARGVDVG
jgi:CPA2 family monovalent cation:H+ antiporter-2